MPLDLKWMISRATRQRVVDLIRRKQDPHRDDLASALTTEFPDEPIPQILIDYVRDTYVRATPRRTGRRPRAGLSPLHILVNGYYQSACTELRGREQTSKVKTAAIEETANRFHLSTRQVKRMLRTVRQHLGPRGT